MPIPITTGSKPAVIRLRKDGVMTFKHNSYIKLSCTSEIFVRPVQNVHEVTVKCLNGSLVEYEDQVYEFDLFRCDTIPKPTLKKTNVACQNNTDNIIAEVGFQTSDAFLKLYNICFNTKTKTPVYSWYHLKAPHFQPYDKLYIKPKLNYTDLYGKVNPIEHYKSQVSKLN